MSDQYLGQIMLTAFNFAPRGFARCDGAVLPVAQNAALFSLFGTTYGGNGQTSFGLPDLRGRTPLGMSQNNLIGAIGGVAAVTLTTSQIPAHPHTMNANTAGGTSRNPATGVLGGGGGQNVYASFNGAQVPLNGTTVDVAGQSQPHSNMQPYLAMNFCVALTGIFPTRG